MEKKITQLNENDKNTLKARTAFILPDNPSAKGFSAEQNKRAQYEGIVLNFHWLQRLAKEVQDADLELEKTIGDNYVEFDGYVQRNDKEIDDLKKEDGRLAGLISDLSGTVSGNYAALDGKIDVVKGQLEEADRVLGSTKLDAVGGIAENLLIHQMSQGDEGATNKEFVTRFVQEEIGKATKKHISAFTVSKIVSTGQYTFTISLSDGTQFSQSIDTPDEKILNPETPPYINAEKELVLTFVDGTSVKVDLSQFVNTYLGGETDYITVQIDAQNVVRASLKQDWIDFLNNAHDEEIARVSNENQRIELYGQMTTLKTNIESTQSKLQPAVNLFKDTAILTQAQYDALSDKSGVRFVEIN